jgi:hypothetical protein
MIHKNDIQKHEYRPHDILPHFGECRPDIHKILKRKSLNQTLQLVSLDHKVTKLLGTT